MFINASQFSLHIEELSISKGITLLDAVILFCEENYIDVTEVVPLVNSTLKDKLQQNYQDLGMLPKQETLESFFYSSNDEESSL